MNDIFLSACDSTLPELAQIVLDKGHHIYADRLYTSVPLVNALESRFTRFTGTVDKRRHQLPQAVRAQTASGGGESKPGESCVLQGQTNFNDLHGLRCEHSDSSVTPGGLFSNAGEKQEKMHSMQHTILTT